MSRTLERNAELLKFLHKAKPEYRKSILNSADSNLIHCICECAHNTLLGKVPLSRNQKTKLKKHKKLLRDLVNRQTPVHKKKKLLVQKGGAILPLLLGPIVSGVLGHLFSRRS